MRFRMLPLPFAVLLVVAIDGPREVCAGPPTDYIRVRIERLYELLGQSGLEGAPAASRQAARGILDEMFDWSEMGKRSLGRYWGERTAAERAEFERLFAELFQRTYLARIQLADREKFQYLGETTEGERAVVKTKVITRKGQEIPVDYHTRHDSHDQWKIRDLNIEGISLVTNYHNQFTTIIRRSSYQDLVQKLRALVQKGPGASRADGAVLVGAGDIASCVSDGDEATARLLDAIGGVVFTLGDHAYEAGTPIEFEACYEPSWGRHKARTHPATGNHDYLTPGASGYFDYFGPAAGERDKGYYSYRLGTWHIVVLNSNCSEVGGCDTDSAQAKWLRANLATSRTACTLAYWHHPRFSSGPHGSDPTVQAFWQTLHDHRAEVVLSGHDHLYERFAPQDPEGRLDPTRGLRQFVVGTGGGSHHRFPGPTIANSEVRNDDTFGVLKMTLYPTSYEWQFVPVAGRTFTDSGAAPCR